MLKRTSAGLCAVTPDSLSAEPVAYGRALLAEVASLDAAVLDSLRLQSAGAVIAAHFSDPDYRALCARNLACCLAPTDSPAGFRVFLLDSESLDWPHPLPWPTQRFDRARLNHDLASAGLRGAYLHDPRVWQFFDPIRRVGVQLIRRPAARPLWESGAPLRAFLHWAHGSEVAQLCHAASVGVNGRGVLLVGAGGSGKSGTTLAAVAGGLDTVGDDYCLVRHEQDRVTAMPLFRVLKQDPGGVRRAFGASAGTSLGALNWQGKHEIHADRLPRDPFVPSLRIEAIVVPRIAGGAVSEFRSLEAGDAMRALAPSSAFQLPDGERTGIAFAAALCRRLPCFEMTLSNDAGEIAASLERFVRALA